MDTLPQFRFANDGQDDASILYSSVLNTRRAERYQARRKEQLGHSESIPGSSDTLLDSRSITGDIFISRM